MVSSAVWWCNVPNATYYLPEFVHSAMYKQAYRSNVKHDVTSRHIDLFIVLTLWNVLAFN